MSTEDAVVPPRITSQSKAERFVRCQPSLVEVKSREVEELALIAQEVRLSIEEEVVRRIALVMGLDLPVGEHRERVPSPVASICSLDEAVRQSLLGGRQSSLGSLEDSRPVSPVSNSSSLITRSAVVVTPPTSHQQTCCQLSLWVPLASLVCLGLSLPCISLMLDCLSRRKRCRWKRGSIRLRYC